ncbi:MAG: bifunctional aspartate kinase/homoserine dehydrogenase I [Gammaproteobacteria bacterium]|nr:bifunctional aspartate kinase/homoserine dehydrogenase I [Gammaproteobacteria bacterium]
MNWTVYKFGGSSLADSECFKKVANIINDNPKKIAIVVSAIKGTTDALLSITNEAAKNQDIKKSLDKISKQYNDIASDLLSKKDLKYILDIFNNDLESIRKILKATSIVNSSTDRVQGIISGYGELWSSRLLSKFLEESSSRKNILCVDSRDILVVDQGEMGAIVDWETSMKNINKVFKNDDIDLAVITGYIARDKNGDHTTLGRNGSDYSASIFGNLLDAEDINIWTDVDGVLTGDPRKVPEANVINEISYSEAMELAYFGAEVIHPQTLSPAVEKDIPIFIKNTFNPSHPGTKILSKINTAKMLIKGVTGIDGVSLVNLEGTGMIGVSGTADRLFGALREAGISVILISQGSSEHSICFAVEQKYCNDVKQIVSNAFSLELKEGQIQKVEIQDSCGIIAIVGDGMAGFAGVAGRFFSTLGNSSINVKAIAQGASERNISAVIDSKDMSKALRAVHGNFYLSAKTVSIGIIGPGSVGRALVNQISGELDKLKVNFNLDLRIRGIANSKSMIINDRLIDLESWNEEISNSKLKTNLDAFANHLKADHLPHAVIIDCTAEKSVANCYKDWLDKGIHIITPNKRANSEKIEYYNSLKNSVKENSSHYLYEATVGAGLPVIQTVKHLVATGDEIYSISGIFSGTLAYLFNVYDGSKPFSKIVVDAKNKGYTEPDPRDDLSGIDVARKAVILAREVGLNLNLDQVSVQSLVPESLKRASVDKFLSGLSDFDEPMKEILNDCESKNQVLRYILNIDIKKGTAEVSLKAFSKDHAFSNIHLTDNIVQFVTKRYCDNPLIVRGPGAGPEVTAAGVFSDLLNLCSMLSAR